MRVLARLFMIFIAFLFAPAALARVQISIDLSAQRMEVQAANGETYSWPISSARAGYVTPRGVFAPTSMQAMHYSKKYHHSPMPHSIFFHGGYAIHGPMRRDSLGRPASHAAIFDFRWRMPPRFIPPGPCLQLCDASSSPVCRHAAYLPAKGAITGITPPVGGTTATITAMHPPGEAITSVCRPMPRLRITPMQPAFLASS